jgi:GNAT superfamily N-acetyltransferase
MIPFTINPATISDVPTLLTLIRELAACEQLAHRLEVTPGSLRAALFGERPVAGALLARVDDFPAGFAVYYHTFSTFVGQPGIFLDDIYVRPEFRNHGIGRALLESIAGIGVEFGGRPFEWIALRWNENAFRFYRRLGASVVGESALLRVDNRQVRNFVTAMVKVAA